MNDPLAYFDSLVNGAPRVASAIRPASAMVNTMMPEYGAPQPVQPVQQLSADEPFSLEQESLKNQIIRNSLSSLAYLGGSLDKLGARQVRGLLGGNPRELLSIIPFSDALGITDPDQVVSGGDLLGTKGKPGLARRIAEIGTEIVLDPMTYLTLGTSAVSKAGKAIKTAGLYDEALDVGKAAGMGKRATRVNMTARDVVNAPTRMTQAEKLGRLRTVIAAEHKVDPNNLPQSVLDDYLDSKLGGMAKASIPFTDRSMLLGTGARGQKMAEVMDRYGSQARNSDVGLWAASVMSPSVMQASTREGQEVAQGLSRDLKTSREAVIKQATQDAYTLNRMGKTSMQDSDRIRVLAEMRDRYHAMGQTISQVDPELGDLVQNQVDQLDDLYQRSSEVGVNIDELYDETAKYFPRFVKDFTTKAGMAKVHRGFDPSQIGREPYLKDWAGPNYQGTASIRSVIIDAAQEIPTLTQAAGGDPAVLKQLLAGWIDQVHGADLIGDHALGRQKVSEKLSKFILSLNDEAREAGGYGNHAVADWMRRMSAGEDAYQRTKHVVDYIAELDNLTPATAIPAGATGADWVSMKNLLAGKQAIGTIAGGGALNIRTGTKDTGGALNYVMAKLNGITPADVAALSDVDYKAMKDGLADLYIPKKVADDLTRLIDLPHTPKELTPIRDIFDSYTSLFKAGVLNWPARFVRDATSGVYQNHLIGAAQPQGYKQAWGLVHGEEIDVTDIPWIKNALNSRGVPITKESALSELKSLLASYEMVDKYQGPISQISNPNTPSMNAQTLDDILNLSPGQHNLRLRDIAKSAFNFSTKESRNPLNIRGVGMGDNIRRETKFAPARAGEDLGYFTETVNRAAPFINLLRKGMDPDEAAAKVMATQVDYKPRNFSVTEREKLTRIFPFYRFTSRQIPFQVRQIMERPGGVVAQTIRGMNSMQDKDMALPEHIAQTAAVPIGGAPEGFQRFVTGFGLPFEDAFGLYRPGTTAYKTVSGTLQELAGRLHPLIKAPFELAAGKQMFSGRELEDLRGVGSDIIHNLGLTENPPNTPILLEQLLSSSPLSRGASSLRTILDPRKGVGAKASQLLTGIRLTDTDIEKSRNLALRNYLEDVLRQNPNVRRFSHLYSPDTSQLSEQDAVLMELYKDLGAESARKSRAAKKAEKAKQAEELLNATGL